MATGNIDIFSIGNGVSTTGEWEGMEFVRANVGYDIDVNATGELDLCHGIKVGLGLELDAEAKAALSIFVKAAAMAELDAAIGANIIAKFETSLLEKFGMRVDVGAFARAEAAVGLSLGLNIDQIKEFAHFTMQQELDELELKIAMDIFDSFLDQLELKAGVWGKASFSAMARAYLNIYGSMGDIDKSGFFLEMGAGVGLEAGVAYDFFTAAKIKNSEAFCRKSNEKIRNYLETKIDRDFSQYATAIKGISIAFVTVGYFVYGLIQAKDEWIGSNDEALKQAVLSLVDAGKTIILQAIMENASLVTKPVIKTIVQEVMSSSEYSTSEKTSITTELNAIAIKLLHYKVLDFKYVNSICSKLANIVTTLNEQHQNIIKEPLSILWCAAAISNVVMQKESGKSLGVVNVQLPIAPKLVLNEVNEYVNLDIDLTTIPLTIAIDYIVARPSSSSLHETLPEEWDDIFTTFEKKLEVTPGELVSVILYEHYKDPNTQNDLTKEELYIKLKKVLEHFLNEAESKILSATGVQTIDDKRTKEYLNEVIRPSFWLVREFILGQVDDMVSHGGHVDMKKFKEAVGLVLYKIVMKNVVVLSMILQNFVQENMQEQFDKVIEKLEGNVPLPMLEAASTQASNLVGNMVSPEVLTSATKELLIDLFIIGKLLYGEVTWSTKRQKELENILLVGLTGKDFVVKPDGNQSVEDYVEAFNQCLNIPNQNNLADVSTLFANVLVEQMSIMLEYLPPALARFVLTITYDIVETMANYVGGAIDDLEILLRTLARDIENLEHDITELEASIERKLREYKQDIDNMEKYFISEATLDKLITAIYAKGLLFLSEENDNLVSSIKLNAYNLAFWAGEPLLRIALKLVLLGLFETLKNLFSSATNVDNLIKSFINTLIETTKTKVLYVPMPEELTPERIADTVKETFITGQFRELVTSLLNLANEKAEQKRDHADALVSQAEKQAEKDESIGLYEDAMASIDGIEIISPESMEKQGTHLYAIGPKVDVVILLKGATMNSVREDEFKRVVMSVNGKPFDYRYSDWYTDAQGIRYEQTLELTSGVIHAGINIFECSVVHEGTEIKRESSSFIVDPNAPELNSINVDIEQSQFDVPNLNDHYHTDQEYVTFINNSNETIDLEGWLLMDAKQHIFKFPEATILTGDSFKVVTGEGSNTDNTFYIGRHAAIWNNKGDIVRLVDINMNLRTLFQYFEPRI